MTKKDINIIISGMFPEKLNANYNILNNIFLAFNDQVHGVLKSAYKFISDDITEFRPSIVLLIGSCMPDGISYLEIRAACDKVGANLCFWTFDDPYEFDARSKFVPVADLIFSNDKYSSLFYNHSKAYHMPLAAPDISLSSLPKLKRYEDRGLDFFFCGVEFPIRKSVFSDILEFLETTNSQVYGDGWSLDSSIFVNERLSFNQLIRFYCESRFVLNIGRDLNLANRQYNLVPSTPGPRTFETALYSGFQFYFLGDLEVEDYYVPGEEIEVFETPQELEEKYFYYRENPEKYIEISLAARNRTLRDHTYTQRAISILGILEIDFDLRIPRKKAKRV